MDLIRWEDKYSVGVDEIDKQHQKIFEFINRFIETFGGESRKEALQQVLEEMIDYIGYHFSCEEKHFKDHPEFDKHHAEHYEFVKKTLELQKDFMEKGEGITQDILTFLVSWLKVHILGTDAKYFSDLKKMSK